MASEKVAHGIPADSVGRILYSASRWLAIFGGLVLSAMAVVTTISVTGRFFFSAPIPGDFELIEVGTGIAVFAFLPWCQMRRDNVVVDFFLIAAPVWVQKFLDAVGSLIFGLIIALFAWRTTVGGIEIYQNDEATYILTIPRWWTFPFAIVCLILLTAVCFYTLRNDIRNLRAPAG
jgi:TRAP-type C4-dicarboxylate transport system permease small subunit